MIDGGQLFDDLWSVYRAQMSSETMSKLEFAELVTYLLFLKIDHERGQRAINPVQVVPEGLGWQSLYRRTGSVLIEQFRHVLAECGKYDPDPDSLIRQVIFGETNPSLRCTPAALHSLMRDVIALTQWSAQGNMVLHDMYSRLMREASERFQIESGQTLTPWPLVSAVVDCLCPTASDVVLDPACGTGSFLVAAQAAMALEGTPLGAAAVTGVDFDPIMCRFATMNYLLSTGAQFDSSPPVRRDNTLIAPETGRPTIVACNPPFRSTAPLPAGRQDLWKTSGSMQLNFLQHIARGLPTGGRAAVFIPDNVLYGSRDDLTVRSNLLQEYDVHTLLRLPTGVFARSGVKTNVIFFDAVRPQGDGTAATSQVWIYDFRSGYHFATKERPLTTDDLKDFVERFAHGTPREARIPTDKFKPVGYQQLAEGGFDLDILWPDDLGLGVIRSPKEIALEIADELHAAYEEFTALAEAFPIEAPSEEP